MPLVMRHQAIRGHSRAPVTHRDLPGGNLQLQLTSPCFWTLGGKPRRNSKATRTDHAKSTVTLEPDIRPISQCFLIRLLGTHRQSTLLLPARVHIFTPSQVPCIPEDRTGKHCSIWINSSDVLRYVSEHLGHHVCQPCLLSSAAPGPVLLFWLVISQSLCEALQ